VAVGGFFIDIDHAIDYVLFNRQRDLRATVFLHYYLEALAGRVVLALHSWELFALLAVIAWWMRWPLLWGYLGGATMHLLLDIAFNSEFLPKNIVAFYSFAYRAAHGFDGATLFGAPRTHRAGKILVRIFQGRITRRLKRRELRIAGVTHLTDRRSSNASQKPAARVSLCQSLWAFVPWEASDRSTWPAPAIRRRLLDSPSAILQWR
jgi:hypothetical protein